MQQPTLQERLSAYQQWRARVVRAIRELDDWLKENQRTSDEASACIQAALAAIHSDRLNIAFLSRGGRGKSELISALLFHDYGRRLLPSYTGHTNPGPIELCWDAERGEASLSLLPIETLGQDIHFAQLRTEPAHWVQHPLDIQDPEQSATRLREMTQTKIVSRAEADRLGLTALAPEPGADPGLDPGAIEIPKWRHAIVSFPSPLLRLGLAIFDLPGLGWTEIATEVLAQAGVVVCVLAADQGVEAADLDLWRRHFPAMGSPRQEAVVVALNEIDQLWGQGEDAAVAQQIAQRRLAAAAALGIEAAQVFPVSAHSALAARIRGDKVLLLRTGIEALETDIVTKLLQAKRKAHVDNLATGLDKILERNRVGIAAGIDRAKTRLTELDELREKSNALIMQMLEKTRQEQETYLRSVQRFQSSREELILETKRCRDILDRDTIEALVVRTHTDMVRSWTTAGMASAMKDLFEELRHAMQAIATDCERIRKVVRETYDGFQHDFGFDLTAPQVFVPMKYRVEIELLYQEVEAFRRSPGLALAEQGVVIKRFQEVLVSRARVLFDQLRAAFDAWIRDTLQPLAERIEEHKVVMEERLDNLQRLGRSKDETQLHIEEAHARYVELAQQLTVLRNIYNTLHHDPAPEHDAGEHQRAAAQRA
jgi:hypothetical protein